MCTSYMKSKVGEESVNNAGNKMKIIKIKDSKLVLMFEHKIGDEIITYIKDDVGYVPFSNGNVRSPYDISIRNFGYIGEGEYKRNYINNGFIYRPTKEFSTYERLIITCEKHKTVITEEWRNFQEFAKWYNTNTYDSQEKLYLTLLSRDLANPETCVLLPASLSFKISKFIDFKIKYPKWNKKRSERLEELLNALDRCEYNIPSSICEKIRDVLKTFNK